MGHLPCDARYAWRRHFAIERGMATEGASDFVLKTNWRNFDNFLHSSITNLFAGKQQESSELHV